MTTHEQAFLDRLQFAESVKETAPSAGGAVDQELERVDSDFKTPLTLRNLFTHHDAHPIVLDLALVRAFKSEWLTWEPETVWASIHSLFNTSISEHNRAKIQAVKTLHVSEAPWELWQVFEKVVQALNNNIPKFDVMQKPQLEQLYVAIDIMDTIRREQFSQEVRSYMAAAVLDEDVFYVPPPMDFIQVEVGQPRYRCSDCGMTYNAIFHDGICDSCTQKFDPEQGLSMQPKKELLQAGFGKKMELTLKYDPDPIQKRWDEVFRTKTEDVRLEETMVDAQVAKLLIARDYMNVRRRQLTEQLISLKSWLGAK